MSSSSEETKKHPNPIVQALIDRARECGTSEPIIETLIRDWERGVPEATEKVVRENMGLAPERANPSKPSPTEDFIREILNPPAPPAPANESVEDRVRREMKPWDKTAPKPDIQPRNLEEEIMRDQFPASWRERKEQIRRQRQSEHHD